MNAAEVKCLLGLEPLSREGGCFAEIYGARENFLGGIPGPDDSARRR